MLKIAEYRNVLGEDGKSVKREKIDLKELEKFGFIDDGRFYHYEIDNVKIEYYVYKENRMIKIFAMDRYGLPIFLGNTLYDLIKADLVEKI